jgi:hypothetical protein
VESYSCQPGSYSFPITPTRFSCRQCLRGTYCPGDDHQYPCEGNTVTTKDAMDKCTICSGDYSIPSIDHTYCMPSDTPKDIIFLKDISREFTYPFLLKPGETHYAIEINFGTEFEQVFAFTLFNEAVESETVMLYASTKTGVPNQNNYELSAYGKNATIGYQRDDTLYKQFYLTVISNATVMKQKYMICDFSYNLQYQVKSGTITNILLDGEISNAYYYFELDNILVRSIVNVTVIAKSHVLDHLVFSIFSGKDRTLQYPNQYNYNYNAIREIWDRDLVVSMILNGVEPGLFYFSVNTYVGRVVNCQVSVQVKPMNFQCEKNNCNNSNEKNRYIYSKTNRNTMPKVNKSRTIPNTPSKTCSGRYLCPGCDYTHGKSVLQEQPPIAEIDLPIWQQFHKHMSRKHIGSFPCNSCVRIFNLRKQYIASQVDEEMKDAVVVDHDSNSATVEIEIPSELLDRIRSLEEDSQENSNTGKNTLDHTLLKLCDAYRNYLKDNAINNGGEEDEFEEKVQVKEEVQEEDEPMTPVTSRRLRRRRTLQSPQNIMHTPEKQVTPAKKSYPRKETKPVKSETPPVKKEQTSVKSPVTPLLKNSPATTKPITPVKQSPVVTTTPKQTTTPTKSPAPSPSITKQTTPVRSPVIQQQQQQKTSSPVISPVKQSPSVSTSPLQQKVVEEVPQQQPQVVEQQQQQTEEESYSSIPFRSIFKLFSRS